MKVYFKIWAMMQLWKLVNKNTLDFLIGKFRIILNKLKV